MERSHLASLQEAAASETDEHWKPKRARSVARRLKSVAKWESWEAAVQEAIKPHAN
jgi:hypothetical protein